MENSNENKEYVASQQNLFSVNTSNDSSEANNSTIKPAEPEDDPFFMQFDFFNQNMKVVKSNVDKQDKVQLYENKFEKLNNLDNEIEPSPSHALDISDLKSMKKITRDKPFQETKKIRITPTLIENASPNKIEQKDKEIKPIQAKDEETPIKIATEKENSPSPNKIRANAPSEEKSNKVDSGDYKLTIGKLFSDSKHEDPYEANRLKSFQQIFPKSQINTSPQSDNSVSQIDEMIATNNSSNIDCEDLKMLNNLYRLQGIKIKTHNSISKKQSTKTYTDKNKLSMTVMLLTSFIMLCEIIISYILIRNSNKLIFSHTIVYFLSGALSISFAVISVLENLFDRYKLIIIKDNFKKELTTRLLVFIIFSVIVFAVCLAFGMKSLEDKHFISLWLIPVMLSSNIVVYYLIRCFLIKQKYFNS